MYAAVAIAAIVVQLLDVAESQSTTTQTTTTTTAGPSCENPLLDNTLRAYILDKHNALRGSLARGQTERNGQVGIAPPAALMYRAKYDCYAESYAQQHANTCDGVVRPLTAYPGYRENVYVLRDLSPTPAGAADAAMNNWWSQMARNGIGSNMVFSQGIRRRRTRRVTKFTKMAWWNNRMIGCAVRNCGRFWFVVCMYAPGGNEVGNRVYNIGAVCSGCPAGCGADGLCPW